MRQYIADGYVVFKLDVPDDLHEIIRQKLQFMVDKDAASAEALLLDTLSDPNGHVTAFALEALRRIGTPSAEENSARAAFEKALEIDPNNGWFKYELLPKVSE